MLVYCRKQRRDARLAPEDASLLKGEWALPTAVLLAGGGRLRERQIGYRACAELFPSTKHRLKLLLINTISQDLSVSPGAHNAEERWSMALHAIASPNIVSSELLSAVLEQVFDLLTAHTGAESIKPLALAALLSLVRNAVNEQFDAASSLLAATRARILALLLTSRHRHSQPSPPSVALLAALSSVIAPSSPVHPILPSAKERLQLHVQLLGRILDQLTSDHASDSSRKGVWAMERALRNIGLELGRLDETEADAHWQMQLDFAQQLIFNANERWKKNLVAGLCLAGTAHVLRDEEAEQAAKLALDWLTPPSADPAVVELLQEPFLFLILRLIALNPSRTFSQVHSAISRIELSDALPATQYLVTKVLRDPAARHALTDAGTATANHLAPPISTVPSTFSRLDLVFDAVVPPLY
ncbi:hypothetical protein Rt10032_c16g5643 [Rhodotorula toruloides]|uniref:Uncharacterized protein n=1 Tax=Rhodotorula toruloides TaxID=5286 RepID=A0A511KP40_RHOTO|nr:hypothetical protein Rt10032_c16g5643 [Rhodotorula toruloides]